MFSIYKKLNGPKYAGTLLRIVALLYTQANFKNPKAMA